MIEQLKVLMKRRGWSQEAAERLEAKGEEICTAKRGWVRWIDNDYFSKALLQVDGETVRVSYDIHNANQVLIRKMDGSFLCVAIWRGNTHAAVPVTVIQSAIETRRKDRQKRLDKRRNEIEAKARILLEAPPSPDVSNFQDADREEAKKNGPHDE